MSTFWEKVRHYANKKVKRQYMDKVGHDRKCHNCKLWTSEVGGAYSVSAFVEDDNFEEMQCRQCHYKSLWDCRGIIPFLAKSQPLHRPKKKGGE